MNAPIRRPIRGATPAQPIRIVRRPAAPPVEAPAASPTPRGKAPVKMDDDYDPLMAVFKVARSEFREARTGGYLHVSDLIGKCIRARALQARYNMQPPPQLLTLSDQFTFAQGDAIHDKAKEIAVRNDPKRAWGKWTCRCKYLRHDEPCTFAEVEPEVCPYCKSPVDQYAEVSIFNDDLGVVGNPDLLMYERAVDAHHVNELKSIAPDKYKELVRPLPAHVLQTTAYWQLMKWDGYRLTDRISIGYITKGWQFGSTLPLKTFTIKVAPELPRLDEYWAFAREYKALVADPKRALPDRVCRTRDDTLAKQCNVCGVCFAGAK